MMDVPAVDLMAVVLVVLWVVRKDAFEDGP